MSPLPPDHGPDGHLVLDSLDRKIIARLDRMTRRDAEKGDAGFCTTREVAEYVHESMARVRRRLERLAEADLIGKYEDGIFYWRLDIFLIRHPDGSISVQD